MIGYRLPARRRTALALALVVVGGLGLAGCGDGAGASDGGEPATGQEQPTSTCQPPSTTLVAGYRTTECLVAAPSLANNVIGDPAIILASVLVPADLGDAGGRRPAVYVLAGFGDSVEALRDPFADELPDDGPGPDAPVLVFASGANGLGGSFYANSAVTGDWEDAIAADLVGFVDRTYPTIPRASARGIAGHSMGGTGALNLAMHRPDVFGTVYALSPGLFDEKGKKARFAGAEVDGVIEALDQVSALPMADRGPQLAGLAAAGGEDARFSVAYGAAFTGDPALPTLMRYPFRRTPAGEVVRDDAVWAAWDAGFGDLAGKVGTYRPALTSLRGIGIDYGRQDGYNWIPPGCALLADLLREAGIPVTEAAFDGGHQEQIGERLAGQMLPFMQAHLTAS